MPMKKSWPLHVAFWLAYLAMEVYIEYFRLLPSFYSYSFGSIFMIAFISEAPLIPVKVALAYFMIFLVFPTGGKSRPWWVIALWGLLALAVASVLRRAAILYISTPLIADDAEPQPLISMALFNLSFVELVMISGVVLALKAYRMRGRWREREELLTREKLESELKFLKAQINPHFLFNTLNNIYALARKQSADTADAVLKLSKLMRFMLFESKQSAIRLEDELKLIDDYIELERLRYGEKLQLTFNKSVDDPEARVAPLLLIHFVENAFKHGASESRFGVRIAINISLRAGVLSASFINSVEESESNNTQGIGLANIRRQLELLYPQHSLDLRRDNKEFHVQLTIPLQS